MLPLKPFYMIRHGESEANAKHITAGGGIDAPLTKLGESQAQTLSPYLETLEKRPSQIFASPMIRAHKTAMLLNESLDLPFRTEENLHETHFGDWEGLPWSEVQPLLDEGKSPPNGENDAVFSTRIQMTISSVLNKTPDEEVPMIVAHGGLFHALGILYEYAMSPIQNCHLHLFEPHPEHALFPWTVWQFDIIDGTLVKNSAPFCSSLNQNIKKVS